MKRTTEAHALIASIVKQAVDDWRWALRSDPINRMMLNDVRRFFKSRWGCELCEALDLDADMMLGKLEREYKREERRRRKADAEARKTEA
jgi:hypothetical protein